MILFSVAQIVERSFYAFGQAPIPISAEFSHHFLAFHIQIGTKINTANAKIKAGRVLLRQAIK